jgi:F0F1-type ATP synthase delta subunit
VERKNLKIPLALASRADVNRLLREVGKLDDFFLGANARQSGSPIQPPRVTRLLSGVAQENQLNLLQEKDRKYLKAELESVAKNAPEMHISFAAEPSPKIMEKILDWLRQNIHPQALVIVGLQPEIAAGLVLRTPNKIFDMSMKTYLKEQEVYLIKLISEVAHG